MKQRKLYAVRTHAFDGVFGKEVGHKSRLIPRKAAQRVAKRLKATKKFEWVEIYPMMINLTNEQCAYLDRRYA